MDKESGQTTIEYVLVLIIIALVIFLALKTSPMNDVIEEAGGKIADRIMEEVAP